MRDGDALDSMLGGTVPAAWARKKAPLWYEELRAMTSTGTSSTSTSATDAAVAAARDDFDAARA